MAYINDDIPYDEYIKKRHKGRTAKPSKWYETYIWNKSLTVRTVFMISPKINEKINRLMEEKLFPNKAEFLRYLIIKFFEDNPEWFK